MKVEKDEKSFTISFGDCGGKTYSYYFSRNLPKPHYWGCDELNIFIREQDDIEETIDIAVGRLLLFLKSKTESEIEFAQKLNDAVNKEIKNGAKWSGSWY